MTKPGRKKRGERDTRRSRPGDNGQPETSTQAVGGRGLGKAGARRLGQMLKRVIQENRTGKAGPVRLLKQKVKISTSETRTEAGVPRVPHLILEVISQCKRRGGMSMEELKQALAAGGYDVTKNNTKVNSAMRGLVRKETIVQTSGRGITGSFKINKKKLTDEKSVKTRAMRKRASKKPKTDKLRRAMQRREAPAATQSPKTTRKGVKLTTKGQSQERKNSTKARKSVPKTKYKTHHK